MSTLTGVKVMLVHGEEGDTLAYVRRECFIIKLKDNIEQQCVLVKCFDAC